MTIKAILFDLDDTLYEEKEFVKSGFKEVAKFISNKFKINEKIFYKILSNVFSEGIRGNIFNIALERLNINSLPLEYINSYTGTLTPLPMGKSGSSAVIAFGPEGSIGSSPFVYLLGGFTDGRDRNNIDIEFDI